jgi:hypothetical protein
VRYCYGVRAYWVIVMAGCWSTPRPVQPDPEPAPETSVVSARSRTRIPSHCERAIDHVLVIMQPTIDSDARLRERQQMLRDAAVEGCLTTGWDPEVLTCYDQVSDMSAFGACFAKLTDDQRDDFNQRMEATLRKPAP